MSIAGPDPEQREDSVLQFSVPATSPERRDFLTTAMRDYLSRFRRKTVFIFPTPGNAGDSLIHVGIYQAFRRAGIAYRILRESDDLEGKTVFFGGGANLVPLYNELRNFILTRSVLSKVARLIILPHTIRGNEDLLEKMDDRVTVFCRDPESYLHVTKHASTKHVYLDHDMALHIDPENFYNDTALYTDLPSLFEHTTSKANFKFGSDFDHAVGKYFRTDGETAGGGLPPGNLDISKLFEFGTWPENAHKASWCLLEAVRRVGIVETDRLHVAIGSSILGKNCRFYDNSYGKNETIYLHSVRKYASCVEFHTVKKHRYDTPGRV